MAVQIEIRWGDPQDPSFVYVRCFTGPIPALGDTISVDMRDTDGTVLAAAPRLVVKERHFHYCSRVEVGLWCEEEPPF